MLEEFRELVRAGILRVTPENEVLSTKPPSSGSERQTAASREEDVALLDKQLLEWMERRREQKTVEARRRGSGKQPEPVAEIIPSGIRLRVVERVAQKILETWDRTDLSSDSHQALREQIVDRVAEDILRRLERQLE